MVLRRGDYTYNCGIFVDMDGTIARWNNNVMYNQLFEKGYYSNLKPENFLDVIRELVQNTPNVYILTCYLIKSKYALDEKNEWLDKWLPELSLDHRIFVPDGESKAKFFTQRYRPIRKEDILIDDYTKNLIEWELFGGTGVKYLNGINHTKGTWQGAMINESFRLIK